MDEFGFLTPDRLPTSVPPNLATLALGAYFIRSVMREPFAHLDSWNQMIQCPAREVAYLSGIS